MDPSRETQPPQERPLLPAEPFAEPEEPLAEPEEAAGPPVADQAARLVARIIDTLLVGIPVATVATELFDRHTAQIVAAPIGFAAVFLVYEVVQLALWERTVGKRLTGIRVVSADGRRLRPVQAIVRAAVYALPPAARPVPVLNVLLGIFWLANVGLTFDRPYRQALHDRAAGTLVIRD